MLLFHHFECLSVLKNEIILGLIVTFIEDFKVADKTNQYTKYLKLTYQLFILLSFIAAFKSSIFLPVIYITIEYLR